MRIFTGGLLPRGADAVALQENASADGDRVCLEGAIEPGTFVRPAGLDFGRGERALPAGRRLTARDVGLAAALNQAWLPVRRRPRVALLATGDELVLPGQPLGPSQIVNSNTVALAAMVRHWGGEPLDLGIVRDRPDSLVEASAHLRGVDLAVTLGGASVGERDLVRGALGEHGLTLDFWQIAMRPGKPLMFGRVRDVPLLGLPGNPVSAGCAPCCSCAPRSLPCSGWIRRLRRFLGCSARRSAPTIAVRSIFAPPWHGATTAGSRPRQRRTRTAPCWRPSRAPTA